MGCTVGKLLCNMVFCMAWSWWRHQMEKFPFYWPFVRGIHRWPVDSPHKGQWHGAFMFFMMFLWFSFCAWTSGWAINRDVSDLIPHQCNDISEHCLALDPSGWIHQQEQIVGDGGAHNLRVYFQEPMCLSTCNVTDPPTCGTWHICNPWVEWSSKHYFGIKKRFSEQGSPLQRKDGCETVFSLFTAVFSLWW